MISFANARVKCFTLPERTNYWRIPVLAVTATIRHTLPTTGLTGSEIIVVAPCFDNSSSAARFAILLRHKNSGPFGPPPLSPLGGLVIFCTAEASSAGLEISAFEWCRSKRLAVLI